MKTIDQLPEATQEHYLFLNRLRESGATNMWGAGEYLEQAFDLSHGEAGKVLLAWMKWVESNPENRDL